LPNFITNTQQQGVLAGHLVQFFGAALGCNDPTFPAYTGRSDMRVVHAILPIGTNEFDVFNGAVISTLAEAGVALKDQLAVMSVLNSTKPAICNLPDCLGVPAPARPTFVVDVIPKGSTSPPHPQTGTGFASGFRIDGVEGRELFLDVGKTYAFKCQQGCAHPFYINTDVAGAGVSPFTTGVTFPQNDEFKGCAGNEVVFTTDASMVGTQLYYGCQVHSNMGWKLNVGGSQPSQQPTTGVGTRIPTIVPTTAVAAGTTAPAATGASTAAGESAASSAIASLFGTLFALLAVLLL